MREAFQTEISTEIFAYKKRLVRKTDGHTVNFPYYLFAYLAFLESYRNVFILLLYANLLPGRLYHLNFLKFGSISVNFLVDETTQSTPH